MEETRSLTVNELGAVALRDENEELKMNAVVGASVSILGTELFVEYMKKGEGGSTLLLVPKNITTPESKSLGELIREIEMLFGGEASEVSELEKLVGKDKGAFDDITVSLSMAYLYIDSDGKDQSKKTVEYAFQLTIDLKNLIPEEIQSLFTFNQTMIAVWNTKNKKVIEAMNLIKPDEYLANL